MTEDEGVTGNPAQCRASLFVCSVQVVASGQTSPQWLWGVGAVEPRLCVLVTQMLRVIMQPSLVRVV